MHSIGSTTYSSWSKSMKTQSLLHAQWLQIRERLRAKQLLVSPDASLSLRIPNSDSMWFGSISDAEPSCRSWNGALASNFSANTHATIYHHRQDVGAIAVGGGAFGLRLADFGGVMPGVFDEQVRHLGCMGSATDELGGVARSVKDGGNVFLVRGQAVCLGMTGSRLALNAELFEKCAKAYVLAAATGGRVKPLPWIVRFVANRRLMKDERRAGERFQRGLLPEESKGY